MNKIFVHKIKSQNGQGLMELIVAIGIIVVGLFSVWALFFSNFAAEQEAETRMTASNLAREGIEAVKNLRDSNWLAVENNAPGVSWDSGFNDLGDSGYYTLGTIFSTSTSYNGLVTLSPIANSNDTSTKLYVNGDGFYDYVSSPTSTPFSRFIVIKNICCASTDGFKCSAPQPISKDIGSSCGSDQIKVGIDVVSEVRWLGADKQPRKATLEDQLFNWR